MCQFFSAVVTRQHAVLFCEVDSHEELLLRLGWSDTDQHLRHWVRVELLPALVGWRALRVDETTTPSWFDPVRDGDRVLACAERLAHARKVYDDVRGQAQQAYNAACGDAARGQARTAYREVCAQAWTAYEEACGPAGMAYIDTLMPMEGYVPSPAATFVKALHEVGV